MNKYFILLFLAYFCRLVLNGHGERLTSLGYTPDWSQLEKYQKTITEFRFKQLLDEVYAPNNAYIDTIFFNKNHVKRSSGRVVLAAVQVDLHGGTKLELGEPLGDLCFASSTMQKHGFPYLVHGFPYLFHGLPGWMAGWLAG